MSAELKQTIEDKKRNASQQLYLGLQGLLELDLRRRLPESVLKFPGCIARIKQAEEAHTAAGGIGIAVYPEYTGDLNEIEPPAYENDLIGN